MSFPASPRQEPPSIASSNLVFQVYIEVFLNSCEIIRHRNPTQKNTKARVIRRIVEFSHGELWSFHQANCRVFTRRIVEFSHGELLETDGIHPTTHSHSPIGRLQILSSRHLARIAVKWGLIQGKQAFRLLFRLDSVIFLPSLTCNLTKSIHRITLQCPGLLPCICTGLIPL